MLIGLLSDTHGFFHPRIPDYFSDVDLILHAGDIGTLEVLNQLQSIAPVRAVWGNVDGQPLRQRVPEFQTFEVEGLNIKMTHIGGHPGRWAPGILKVLRDEHPDVFICGHSHILRVDRVRSLENMLFINPGAAGRQGFHQVKTCIRLLVESGKAQHLEVVHLDQHS